MLESYPQDQKNISFAGDIAGKFIKEKAQSSLLQMQTFWSNGKPEGINAIIRSINFCNEIYSYTSLMPSLLWCLLIDEIDDNLAAMVRPMAQMTDQIDFLLDAEQVSAYNIPVKQLSSDLYKLYAILLLAFEF